MPIISNTMEWDKVAIPLVKGVDTGVRFRLADPATLQIADNIYFPRDGGPEKRYGYTSTLIKKNSGVPTNSLDYTYGFGIGSFNSDYANAGPVRSIAKRDSEIVTLAGSSLYNNKGKISEFDCFSAVTKNIAKSQVTPNFADMAYNNINKVVAYHNQDTDKVDIFCYDTETGALKFRETSTVVNTQYVTVLPVEEYIHVYISDYTLNTLYLHVIFPNDTSLNTPIDLGECKLSFDVVRTSDNKVLIAKRSNTNGILTGYVNQLGLNNSDYIAFNTVLNIGGDSVTGFAISIHPDDSVGVIWDRGTEQKGRVYDRFMNPLAASRLITSLSNNEKLSICPDITTASRFYYFVDYIDASQQTVYSGYFDTTSSGGIQELPHCGLVGKAFNIGASPFIWVCRKSTLQNTYLICNKNLRPVGKLEYGTAVNNEGDQWLFSSHVEGSKVHGALLYKRNIINQPGVFHEQSIKEYVLDFDFKPRAVQAGRCLYYPGAQLSVYDGHEVVESGFHFAVEDMDITPSNSTGSLTSNGIYYYLVYACHKNAQGEEVRGPAILSAAVTLGATDDTVTILGDTIPTLRDDSYFLVFRNVNGGTNWHLVSSRDYDSANCPKNTQGVPTWTFVDTVSDAALISRELDNFTTDNYLMPFSGPSCEVISYGKDRLWVSGGEIPGYQVWASRLFDEYTSPAFHPVLKLDVDKSLNPVTAIGFISNYCVVFKRDNAFIVAGDGIDNVSVGSVFGIQQVLTDVGAVSSALKNISAGIVFQSSGSYRVVSADGRVTDISGPVKDYNSTCSGIYLNIDNTDLHFYQDNCILCWNYEKNVWSRWTLGSAAVTDCEYIGIDNKILKQGNDYFDDGLVYTVRIKTAPFSAQLGNFQRIRRIAGAGHGSGRFTVNTYLDEKEYTSDVFDITKPDNSSTWGSGTWGSGFWGDSNSTGPFASDDRMRWVKRVSVQKCTCISIEFVYTGTDSGPVHYCFIVEFGIKNGIDRRK
jgi:hypothetical protein